MRKIVIIGWDGRSNPMYRFHDELCKADHMRSNPKLDQILEQFPAAMYTTSKFTKVPLRLALS